MSGQLTRPTREGLSLIHLSIYIQEPSPLRPFDYQRKIWKMFLFCFEVKKLDASVKSYDSAGDTKVEKKEGKTKQKIEMTESTSIAPQSINYK